MKKEKDEEKSKFFKKRILLVLLLLLLLLIPATSITVVTLNGGDGNDNTAHVVTFVNGDEEVLIPQVTNGGKIPKPADPIKESTEEASYEFEGWYTDAEFTQPFDFERDKITKDTKLYAKFIEIVNKYKVSFYVGSSLYTLMQNIEYGENITEPTDPTKANTNQFTYAFVGWYTDSESAKLFNFEKDTITKDTVLYAKFSETTNKYQVSFYVGNELYGEIQNIEYGKYATKPEAPTKTNTAQFTYEFEGWYTDAEFTQSFNFEEDAITKETKLYAKFSEITNKYQVSFYVGNELYGEIQSIEYGNLVSKPTNPTKTNTDQFTYEFEGWYTDAEFTQSFDFEEDVITKETKLYAKFSETTNKCEVSFYVGNELYGEIQNIEYGNLVFKPTNPTKTNTAQFTYKFVGWYTDSELTQPFDFEEDVITQTTKLYAKFSEITNKYEVSFYVDDELYGQIQNIEYEGHATKPEDPTKTNTAQFTYEFVGWYTDSELTQLFNFNTDTITKETKLYAKFSETTNKYQVSFYVGNELYAEIQNIEYGKYATKPEAPTKTNTAQFTYTFEGWYTDAEFTQPFDFEKDTITKETKLYAKFTEITNKYQVSFYVDDDPYGQIQNIEYGGYISEPTAPTKVSTVQFTYEFEGWYTDSGLTLSFDFEKDTITKETKLYAKFIEITNKYQVSFYVDNELYGEIQNIEYGKKVITPTAPTKVSTPQFTYEFEGWYTDSEFTQLFDLEEDIVTKDTVLYAKFGETDLVLEYTLNSDGKSYSVYRTIKDVSDIRIPYFHEGKPVTSIGGNAFYFCRSLTSVIIADSVITIEAYAFGHTSNTKNNLTNVIIGNSVESIGDYAFYNCAKITNINIPDSVKTIGNYAFSTSGRNRSNLKSVTGGNGLESIGKYAFSFCFNLTNITLPESMVSIGEFAFRYCESLTSLIIPSSVNSIGRGAFSRCKSLNSITVSNDNIEYYSIGNCIIEIETKAIIAGCMTSIIPEDGSIEIIEDYAFCGAQGLTNIAIPDSVTSIGSYAFSLCGSLTSITIPSSAKIGYSAFSQCSSLTSITIPEGVTSIGKDAFSSCSSLTSITIPNSVTSIEDSVFENCSSLTSITIPNSVTSIGSKTFSSCSSLTSITIPKGVTSIGDWAFERCYRLVEIYNLSNLTITKGSTDNGDIGLHAKGIYTSLETKSKVISIEGGYKFYNDNGAYYLIGYYGDETELILPAGINGNSYSINDYAFTNFIYLKSVTIPTYVTKIGYRAFEYCRSITSITFENVEGWYVTTNNNTTSGSSVDVSDSSQNATYLVNKYYNYYWYRK